jgi:hypothetical protein
LIGGGDITAAHYNQSDGLVTHAYTIWPNHFIVLCGRIDKPRHRGGIMTGDLPPKVPFHALSIKEHSEGFLAVGIDGEFLHLDASLQPVGDVMKPFPMSVRHATITNGVLVGTWIDHELLMARMAGLDVSAPFKEGPERGKLRTRTSIEAALHPAGAVWSHVLDAEPLALCGFETGFAFVLYRKGIYAMGKDAGEHWRVELPIWPELSKLPRASDIVTITHANAQLKVWSRGGGTQVYAVENGDLLSTSVFLYDGVLQHVYNHGDHELLVYDNGSMLWLHQGNTVVEGKLGGPIQHAFWNEKEEAWRVAGWREELLLSHTGVQRSKMDEIPVHILWKNDQAYLLLNNGTWIQSSLE